jgi:hypothetical protein
MQTHQCTFEGTKRGSVDVVNSLDVSRDANVLLSAVSATAFDAKSHHIEFANLMGACSSLTLLNLATCTLVVQYAFV